MFAGLDTNTRMQVTVCPIATLLAEIHYPATIVQVNCSAIAGYRLNA